MTHIEITKALNLARAELGSCYKQLGTRSRNVINLINEYCKTMPRSMVIGGGYCRKQNIDNNGSCFFQCEECKMKSVFNSRKLLKVAVTTMKETIPIHIAYFKK